MREMQSSSIGKTTPTLQHGGLQPGHWYLDYLVNARRITEMVLQGCILLHQWRTRLDSEV